MAEVRINQLVKVFPNGTVAVQEVNLDVADGEFLVLLGPSGCGKTTTLRCIAGLERQTSGNIWIGDHVVNDLKPGDRDIAFVFQFYALYPHLNVYSNISFPLRAMNVDRTEIDQRVREVAKVLRIEHVLGKRPRRLPSGEQQRVALGRAIIRRPQVFLMDEPLTNLDAALRTDMRVELKHLQAEIGTTMLYVTHDQTEAMSMGHRIAVMNKGVLQQVGTPLEIYQHPQTLFVAGFIGDPPMNLVPVELVENMLHGIDNGMRLVLESDVVQQVREKQSGKMLILGIRAENIHLTGNGNGGDVALPVATRSLLGDQA
ncbi:MAG: ABC transporter ATP-binding protein, partial [Chloroflexi bacterium]|nr:ABC transporter ATP-binding protein [Chloroflexota bacterium]